MFIRIRLLAEWQYWWLGVLYFFSWIILHEGFLNQQNLQQESHWDMLTGQIEYEIMETRVWSFWQQTYPDLESAATEQAEWISESQPQVVYSDRIFTNTEDHNSNPSAQPSAQNDQY